MIQLDLLQGCEREPFPSARLQNQRQRVEGVMTFCHDVTLAEIARMAVCSEASASARLRELRSRGWTITRRKISAGLYAYSGTPA